MQLAEANRHIVLALAWYRDAGHKVGHLTCRQLQVRLTDNSAHPPWSSFKTTNTRVMILLAQQFKKEDDMVSLLEVLMNIQQFAYETCNSQLHIAAARNIGGELSSKSGSWLLEVGFQPRPSFHLSKPDQDTAPRCSDVLCNPAKSSGHSSALSDRAGCAHCRCGI